ncbi:DUF6285 domain-containing protein [Comamonas sp. JC664]|uniref:DUF6285 domain-containing protein n=1 Tax=Comamonas sp. JC664 TaxID=2801917 RepID=UPI001748A414|nr:DUF6285 domain-containing protein [Comamonas sp. JC664]MBL0698214.1 hypothetical protein [Comamonas sp. JC664]GHG89011.1 hypothetical protein GCM10012319_48030 [Comamonas sp. KCTC 72670]
MRERPDGAELLAVAREVLLEELLPLLPGDRAYSARMIANAMGIAERQLRNGDGPQERARKALSALLGREGALPALMREFAVRIRQGQFDDSAEARGLLWASTVQRVRESAPKALSDEDRASSVP